MLKQAIALSAMCVCASAMAQDKAPVQSEAVPAATTPGAPKSVPPIQGENTKATPTTNPYVATQPAKPVKTDDGSTQTPPDQVASIVAREFGSYDRNRNGVLEKEEFGTWMAALKARAPDATPDDKPDPTWTLAAFGKADADKSQGVSRVELASFFNGTKPAAG